VVFGRTDDLIQPFQVEDLHVLGRLVRLGETVDTVLRQHAYPEPVSRILGESLALTASIAGALKYEGVFSLQTQGDGPLRAMVADVTSEGAMRGYASFDAERIAHLGEEAPQQPVPRMLGAGFLTFTVDQGPDTERYQGMVDLSGATMAECAHRYFRQSEQLDAVVKLAVGRTAGGRWRAGGLMLQRTPLAGGLKPRGQHEAEAAEDDWRRALALASSTTTAELLDENLPPDRLLYRLYHVEGVRVFRPVPLSFGCRCSRARCETVLVALPGESFDDMVVEGKLHVTCQFCNRTETFDEEDVRTLRAKH